MKSCIDSDSGIYLTSEPVDSLALTLESINDIERGDRLPSCMLRVCDRIPDDILEEHLQDTTRLFVDQAGDTLDTTTTGQTTNSGLSHALDVVSQDLAVTLGAAFAQTFASLTSTRHIDPMNPIGE